MRMKPVSAVTMVEILVGLSLFAVLLMPLWFSLSQSNEILMVGSRELDVLSIGRTFLSQVRGLDPTKFAPLPSGEKGPGFQAIPEADQNGVVHFPGGAAIEMGDWKKSGYSLEYTVFDFARPSFNKIVRWVELDVKWKDPLVGEEKTTRFPTVLIGKKVLDVPASPEPTPPLPAPPSPTLPPLPAPAPAPSPKPGPIGPGPISPAPISEKPLTQGPPGR